MGLSVLVTNGMEVEIRFDASKSRLGIALAAYSKCSTPSAQSFVNLQHNTISFLRIVSNSTCCILLF